MEVGTLEHHVTRGLVGTRSLAAEDAGDTHGLLGVADAQVVLAQDMLLTVEGNKLGTLGLRAHHNLVARHHVGVKAVHGLSVGHHDVVGDVNDIVDGAQADSRQLLLHPLGTLLDLAVSDAHTGITLAGLRVLNLDVDGKVVVVDRKL